MTDAPADQPTSLRDAIAAAILARIKQSTISGPQPFGFDAYTHLLAANEYDLADVAMGVVAPHVAVLDGPSPTPARRRYYRANDEAEMHAEFMSMQAAIARARERCQQVRARVGPSGMINASQILGMLSLTWPDGNYKAALDGSSPTPVIDALRAEGALARVLELAAEVDDRDWRAPGTEVAARIRLAVKGEPGYDRPGESAELVCVDECGNCDACGMEPFGTPAEGWREAARFLRRTPRDSRDYPAVLTGARVIEAHLRVLTEATTDKATED